MQGRAVRAWDWWTPGPLGWASHLHAYMNACMNCVYVVQAGGGLCARQHPQETCVGVGTYSAHRLYENFLKPPYRSSNLTSMACSRLVTL